MADSNEPPRRFDPVGIGVLLAAVLVVLAAWWLFPVAERWIANQDCVASGRVNCQP